MDHIFCNYFFVLIYLLEVLVWLLRSQQIRLFLIQINNNKRNVFVSQLLHRIHRKFKMYQLTLLQLGGQIMPITLLLAHQDLKTQRQLWIFCIPLSQYILWYICSRNIATQILMSGPNLQSKFLASPFYSPPFHFSTFSQTFIH